MPTVTIPGHGEVDFPDSMNDDQIAAAIKKNSLAPEQASTKSDQSLLGILGNPSGYVAGKFMEGQQKLSDAAYEAGGYVAEKTGSPALGVASNVALQAVPMVLGGEAAKVAAPGLEWASKWLMRTALKPDKAALRAGGAIETIDTLLKEGINITQGGVRKLRGLISGLNDEIKDTIAGSTATVPKAQVYQSLKGAIDKFTNQVNPQSDLAAIDKAWDEFRSHPLLKNINDIPVQLAQRLKQGTYKVLEKKYGMTGIGTAEDAAQKALARGLKEGVADAVPDIAGLNAHESKLLQALKPLEHRALMDLNKNPAGLSLLTTDAAKFAAFMADRSSAFKSIVARMIYAGKQQIPATTARAGIAGAEVASQPDNQEEQ